MSEPSFRQYLGPSSRHARACVELRFPLDNGHYRLAPLEPVLRDAGLKLREALPGEPLPLEVAVSRLAGALLARHARWWNSHGRDGDHGWAALGHPYPHAAATALQCAFALVRGNGTLPPRRAAQLHKFSQWLESVSKIKLWMLFAAEICGRDAPIVNEDVDINQVGQGAKGVHMCRAGSQRDGLTGIRLESSKQTTVETLSKFGLPTTTGMLVRTSQQAVEAARELGLPCVVKPLRLSRGTGVAAGLMTEDEVAAAAEKALKLSKPPVRVEKHAEGDAHRMLVGANELLWTYRKRAARVTGDGTATIATLIDRENERRANNRDIAKAHLVKIVPDDALRLHVANRYGLTLDDVPAKGATIELSGQANTASGGTIDDLLSITHPDNRALAIRVARLFRLEVMGIDFMTPDISRSWKEVPSAIIEVNRTPSLNALGDATLVHRMLFPNKLSGRIPMVAVIGGADYCAEVAETLRAAFAQHGLRLATADYRERNTPAGGVLSTPATPRVEALLLDPEADATAVLCDPMRVEQQGFPLRECDLLVREDKAPLAWLEHLADTVLRGRVSQARIDLVAARLTRRYGDPAEGSPLPALEPVEGAAGEFRVKVWRTKGMPRIWFWREVGIEAPRAEGLTTHEDLLGAVRALAGPKLGEFAHEAVPSGWAFVNVEAAIALPAKQREETRAALLAATERVNAIVAMKTP